MGMSETLRNTIEIGCTPEQLYAYVTQPWCWHEWHPNSRSARAEVDILAPGDEFEEHIELQPLSPLPWRMRRSTRYRVVLAQPARLWEVEGLMHDGWVRIRYEFESVPAGARFTRTLSYRASGPSRLLMPLLRPRMKAISIIALDRLKRRLEPSTDAATAAASDVARRGL